MGYLPPACFSGIMGVAPVSGTLGRPLRCLPAGVRGSQSKVLGFMNKGYAFGFLIVLLVLILGFYVAYTGFVSSRQALHAQATPLPATRVVKTPRPPTATATATTVILSTPVSGITATLTALVPVGVTEPPPPTEPPELPSAEPLPSEPPPEPSPSATPLPTPVPVPAYQFRLISARPDAGRAGCCYIGGTIRDGAGNMLEGVRIRAYNEWQSLEAISKGGVDLGHYDIPIGIDRVNWYVIVVDAAGNPVSPQAVVQFDPGVAGWYWVEWQRTY